MKKYGWYKKNGFIVFKRYKFINNVCVCNVIFICKKSVLMFSYDK